MADTRGVQALLNHAAQSHYSDRRLVEGLVRREPDAFAELLRRHGPMVLGVCRRLLRQPMDVEDAFQATFLVLLRRAEQFPEGTPLGGWLHEVARRTALHARRIRARQPQAQEKLNEVPGPSRVHATEEVELQTVLDGEIAGLPKRYRQAIVHCLLKGETRAEAAAQLGWAEGTVASRLARGRELLKRRLSRRGISLEVGVSVVSLPLALTAQAMHLFRAYSLAGSTSGVPASVACLTQGVILMMQVTKLQNFLVVVLLLSVTGWGVGWLAAQEGPATGFGGPPGQEGPATGFGGPPGLGGGGLPRGPGGGDGGGAAGSREKVPEGAVSPEQLEAELRKLENEITQLRAHVKRIRQMLEGRPADLFPGIGTQAPAGPGKSLGGRSGGFGVAPGSAFGSGDGHPGGASGQFGSTMPGALGGFGMGAGIQTRNTKIQLFTVNPKWIKEYESIISGLLPEVNLVVGRGSGSLIVRASQEEMKQVETLIEMLRKRIKSMPEEATPSQTETENPFR